MAIPILILILGFILTLMLVSQLVSARRVVQEHEAGLLYVSGKYVRTLAPGGYWLLRPFSSLTLIDLRTRIATVSGQEVMSSDNVAIKVSLLLRYRVAKPAVAVREAVSYEDSLYADAQVALREMVGSLPVEELVAKRDTIGTTIEERLKPKAEALGLSLESAGIKDFVFPPPLRQVFHQVVEARMASQASLERARGEAAALRSLANAARMLDNNPSLLALKTLQTVSTGNHTLVMGTPSWMPPPGGKARMRTDAPTPAPVEDDPAE